jgi:uncharacterized surface protein with fasciclin (FAS1) repeats
MKAKTGNGQELDVQANEAGVTVNAVIVTKTDIVASNGVIHFIDTVVMPS